VKLVGLLVVGQRLLGDPAQRWQRGVRSDHLREASSALRARQHFAQEAGE
jgi:hypothetical protein